MAEPDPHFLFVSFPDEVQLNALLCLSMRVAAKGPLVTFSTTLDFGRHIRASNNSNFRSVSESMPIPVGLGFLQYKFFDDEPDHDDPPSDSLEKLIDHLEESGHPSLADLIHRQSVTSRPFSCIVCSRYITWALDLAHDFSIPGGVVWDHSCAVFSTYYHYHRGLTKFPNHRKPHIVVHLPGIPPMAPHELPTLVRHSTTHKSLVRAIFAQFTNMYKACFVFVNSFAELEHDAVQALSKLISVVPVGPFLATGENFQVLIEDDTSEGTDSCLEWLNSQQPKSVVYVFLGRFVKLSPGEAAELAIGLNISRRPFLWEIKENDQHLLPEGFKEEMEANGKGMVVGWSRMERVLASEAVGCFITDCAWNIALEAMAAGVPLVAYPQWGDQVLNAKLLCEVHKVGVRLPAAPTRDDVEQCVAKVMDGEDAATMRERAAKWKEVAGAVSATGGSSDRNIDKFVDNIRKLVVAKSVRQ